MRTRCGQIGKQMTLLIDVSLLSKDRLIHSKHHFWLFPRKTNMRLFLVPAKPAYLC